jgi:hypothetical protein
MTISKKSPNQPPGRGNLFDSILDARSAFKKTSAESSFPALIDPELINTVRPTDKQKLDPKAVAKVNAKEAAKRSLLPTRSSIATAAETKEPNPYVYAGPNLRLRTEWQEVAYDDALPFEMLDAQKNKSAVEQAKAKIRRSVSKKTLDGRSKLIIDSLPKALRPLAIIAEFPHIMNLIASSWHEPRIFVQTLDELMMNERGNRAGFPFAIIVELTDLREHYFSSVRPEARKLWDRL